MQLSEFDYHLPESQIAQMPAAQRDASRLMVVPGRTGTIEHLSFSAFPALLRAGDLLVLNDTRVIRARLHGRKESGGKVEILLDRPLGPESQEAGECTQEWSCLLRSSRPVADGARIILEGGGEALGRSQVSHSRQPRVLMRLPQSIDTYLDRFGEVPLPAYIQREGSLDPRSETDWQRYQTVYAKAPGAVAAPTAGLHFTEEMLSEILTLGIEVATLTLHVGPGTFLPVRAPQIEQHEMHSERYLITDEAARAVTEALRAERRVVAVGTTVVRALEAAWNGGELRPGAGETDLFIYPGFAFQVVDAMLTNFHLPRSTLLMLVCAFAGTERVLSAYRQAVERGYRFYSYGDATFFA